MFKLLIHVRASRLLYEIDQRAQFAHFLVLNTTVDEIVHQACLEFVNDLIVVVFSANVLAEDRHNMHALFPIHLG